MKKIISMVLILTLTLSLFTIGASANSNCNHDETYEYFAAGSVKETDDGKCSREGYFIRMCELCESEISEPYMKTENGEHNFESGRCTKCFTEATEKIEPIMNKECMHYSAYTQEGYSNIYPDGDLCITDTYTTEYCPECGYVSDEEKTTQKSTHVFKNSYCINCGVSQQETCEHTYEPYPLATAATCNEDGKCLIRGYFELRCVKCEQRKGNEYSDTIIKEHNYNSEGICTNCYYNGKNSFSSEVTKIGYVVGTDNLGLRLRKGASTATAKIATIPEGASVEVIEGEKLNDFYKVRWNGMGGFAHSDYITFSKLESPSVGSCNYVWPASGFRISVLENYYGLKGRPHPTYGNGSVLGAIDIASTGNAYAVANARVEKIATGWNSGWGNYCLLRLDDGNYAFYGHLAQIYVSKGQQLSVGQSVGKIGTTGNSTGVHLHFEVISGKNTLNSLDFFKEKYKQQLVFDKDIVSGGGNSAALRNYITKNYKLSGNVYVYNPAVATVMVTTAQTKPQVSQSAVTQTNSKVAFMNSMRASMMTTLDAQKQASDNVLAVVNDIYLRENLERTLGVAAVTVKTLNPIKLGNVLSKDAAIGLAGLLVSQEFARNADISYYRFLELYKKGEVKTETEAKALFEAFKTATSLYQGVISSNYDTVSSFTSRSYYTKTMLKSFLGGVADSALGSLKAYKAYELVNNTADLYELIKNSGAAETTRRATADKWQNLYDKA